MVSEVERIADGEERWQSIEAIGSFVIVLVVHTPGSKTTAMKSFGSFRLDSQRAKEVRRIAMRRLTAKQREEIEALAKLPDNQIDTSDIPEAIFTDRAVVGKFYRPIKKPVAIRLDADVLAWLRHFGPGYQSRINDILRREMAQSGKIK